MDVRDRQVATLRDGVAQVAANPMIRARVRIALGSVQCGSLSQKEPSMSNPHDALAGLGLALPPAPKPVAAYVPAVRTGNMVFVSGQLPFSDGALLATGPVPSKVSVEDAQKAARQCALNALSVLADQLGGDLSRVVRIVRLGVFVQSDDRFDGQPKVANGASEFMQQVFGEAGRHARAAVGTNALPLDACVEVEVLAEVR
jgi:enamine deaminase RidA (YjgF/YER057c/UK114 family)